MREFERRHTDRIWIQHVVRLGVVVAGGKDKSAVEQLSINADIDVAVHFPLEVRVLVLQFSEGDNVLLPHRSDARRTNERQRGVVINSPLVACPSYSYV